MPIKYELFPEAYVQLIKEIQNNHPELVTKLLEIKESGGEPPIVLAAIALHLNILLDGMYSIPELSDRLLIELKKLRSPIITSTSLRVH